MFIINITYKVPLDEVDTHLEAHITFLNEQYQAGRFLASGRKVPRDGGIILAKSANKDSLLKILEEDPFKIHNLADYEVTEFIPSKAAPNLEFLL